MLVPDSYEPDGLRHKARPIFYKLSVVERLLTVLVSSIQWCVALGFILAIVSAGTWSVQHHRIGYATLFLSVLLCAAMNPIHRVRVYFDNSPTNSSAMDVKVDVPHRLLRRTGITLLVLTGITVITGWMYTLEFFWGLLWIEDVHSLAAYAAAGLLFLYCAMALNFKHWSHWAE